MRKVVQFIELIVVALTIVGLIIMLNTNGLVLSREGTNAPVTGASLIFGGKMTKPQAFVLGYSGAGGPLNNAWTAIFSFINIIWIIMVLVTMTLLPLLGIYILEPLRKILTIVSGLTSIADAIFIFRTPHAFKINNTTYYRVNYALQPAWIIAAILFILAGILILAKPVLQRKFED